MAATYKLEIYYKCKTSPSRVQTADTTKSKSLTQDLTNLLTEESVD